MEMNLEIMRNIDEHYVMPTYGRSPVLFVRGKGAKLFDADGREYIDFGSGIGVNSLGYADRKWVRAVQAQAKQLAHVSNLYYSPNYILLAEALCNIAGMEQVFFGNSGAEANEGAIKLARKYSFDKYGKGRHTIVTLVNSFHGRTLTTLSATGQDVFHNYFFPFTEGFKFVPANDIAALEAALDGTVCAVMLEPVQGEGGVMPLDREFFQKAAALAAEKDILLICDEVQTGTGRTGTFLASQQYGVKPDIVTLAKGLGGGLPIGAFLCNKKLAGVMGKSSHGSTFGGNPIACAGALAVLEQLSEPGMLETVASRGEYIRGKIRGFMDPHIGDVRGMGLMIGVELVGVEVADLLTKLRENGLIALSAKSVLRLLPPLTITKAETDKGLAALKKTLAELP